MQYKSNRCTECDSLLWSNHAKECGLCPECENVDAEQADNLETQFEELTK